MNFVTPEKQVHTVDGPATQNSIRLVIADDRAPAREGLRAFLTAPNPEIGLDWPEQKCLAVQIVGEASDGLQAVQLVDSLHPDVVIMDVRMPGLDGIQATRMIKSQWPDVRVIILTFYGAHYEEAIRAGADAFLLKGCPPGTLYECLVKVGLKLGG